MLSSKINKNIRRHGYISNILIIVLFDNEVAENITLNVEAKGVEIEIEEITSACEYKRNVNCMKIDCNELIMTETLSKRCKIGFGILINNDFCYAKYEQIAAQCIDTVIVVTEI